MDCPSCGTAAARFDQPFCAKCGTSLAPVEPPTAYGDAPRITGPLFADDLPSPPPGPPAPPPPPAPPTFAVPPAPQPAFAPPLPPESYDDSRAGRRRTSIVLLAAAALVAALIGAGGVVLLFAGDDDPTSDASAEDRHKNKKATTDGGPTTSSDPEQSESETAEPATFRCWSGGAAVARLAACPPPTGEAGLTWVFPSSTGATCTPKAGAQRESEAECAPVVAGAAVRFHYSEWRTRAALETYYGSNTISEIGAPRGRTDLTAMQVESRDSSVGYKVAIYYTEPSALWSVTVYAADEAQYVAAISELDVRPFRQLRGERG